MATCERAPWLFLSVCNLHGIRIPKVNTGFRRFTHGALVLREFRQELLMQNLHICTSWGINSSKSLLDVGSGRSVVEWHRISLVR